MRQVQIIGGGIAGLTLGILLRRAGVPVELWEAHNYPRHRVCGEFISGRGAKLLLELVPELQSRSEEAKTVRFFTGERSTPSMNLPVSGISISRWKLDDDLANAFVSCGGRLRIGQRWSEEFNRPAVVRATGRRIANNGCGWIGLKAHLRSFVGTADLEMHFSRGGYVGISRVPSGANICALVRGDFALASFRQNPATTFKQLLDQSSAERLAMAEFVPESCCAVAGISSEVKGDSQEFCIGDALRMIPPFTGNGMSLAIESAFLAAPILLQFSQADLSWHDAVALLRRRCAKEFRARFANATLLRALTTQSWTRELMLSSLRTVPQILSICFSATR